MLSGFILYSNEASSPAGQSYHRLATGETKCYLPKFILLRIVFKTDASQLSD